MKRCIFCLSSKGPFTTREHILPESLGGGDWACLPEGHFCDSCQNRFGSEIEQQALAQYPFSFLRVFLRIPTKKRKAPWLKSWEGILKASIQPGTFGYDPATPFVSSVESNKKTALRILAVPEKPEFVCRTLLKMGIEVIASHNPEDAFNPKFDAARTFALTGKKDGIWWYLQREDMTAALDFIQTGITELNWQEDVCLSTRLIGDEGRQAEMFHLQLFYLELLVPLEQFVYPPPAGSLPEPEFRVFAT